MATFETDAVEVHAVLDALANVGCRTWVAGGWGVDALVGRQTRPHRDLDLALVGRGVSAACVALNSLGYEIETDWRPIRVQLAAPERGRVDLHPVVFDAAGNGRQSGLDGGSFWYPAACFVSGLVTGRVVACLSVDQQIAFHRGYPLRDVDRADLAQLHQLQAVRP